MANGLIRLHVYELQIGMFVAELDIPWEQSPFKLQGFEITSLADIKAVQNVCDYVAIDSIRQQSSVGKLKSATNISLSRTFSTSADTYEQTSSLVKTLMDDVRFGNQLNVHAAKQAVAACVDSVIESPDAMLLLTQLKNSDEYTSQHSLNVCILTLLLGRSLRYNIEKLTQIGICGLLHDMGKMKVPNEILNKPGKLNDEELAIMRSHTTSGRDILMSARGVFPGAVDVAFAHHERLDGKGYPRKLQDSGITPYTRIVSIVDTYDALTSDRVYQKGRLHLEAINILTKSRDTHFEGSLVIRFIDCIGIYPVGNLVEMTNGEICIVIQSNPQRKSKPKLLRILDGRRKPVSNRLLDMSDDQCSDTTGQPYKIYKVLGKEEFKFNLYDYYKQGKLEQALQNLNAKNS